MRLTFGLHIELEGKPIAPPLWELLVALEREGSLAAAARACGFSYRRAWEMLRTAERVYGCPLAVLERGRGARPTELAKRMLLAHLQARSDTAGTLERIAKSAARALARTPPSAPKRLQLCASHDLALIELKHLCALASPTVSLDLQFRGSLETLDALARSRCEVAGFHIYPGADGDGRWRRLLQNRTLRLVVLARRRQGLMVAASNPKAIRGLADLARKNVRFINRQEGSGTRLLVDQLLARMRTKPAAIRGYDHEEFTHLAVAATIASGHADAGVGIEAAAARYGLTFFPLAMETYYLAMRRGQLEREPIRSLLQHLSSLALRRRIRRLPGYDARHTGEQIQAAAVLAQSQEPLDASGAHPAGAARGRLG